MGIEISNVQRADVKGGEKAKNKTKKVTPMDVLNGDVHSTFGREWGGLGLAVRCGIITEIGRGIQSVRNPEHAVVPSRVHFIDTVTGVDYPSTTPLHIALLNAQRTRMVIDHVPYSLLVNGPMFRNPVHTYYNHILFT
jgi:hypothetical protein